MSHIITTRGRMKPVGVPAPHDVELLNVYVGSGTTAIGSSFATVPVDSITQETRASYFTVSSGGEITNNNRLARAKFDYAVTAGTTDGAAWEIEVILELDGIELPGTRRYAHGG